MIKNALWVVGFLGTACTVVQGGDITSQSYEGKGQPIKGVNVSLRECVLSATDVAGLPPDAEWVLYRIPGRGVVVNTDDNGQGKVVTVTNDQGLTEHTLRSGNGQPVHEVKVRLETASSVEELERSFATPINILKTRLPARANPGTTLEYTFDDGSVLEETFAPSNGEETKSASVDLVNTNGETTSYLIPGKGDPIRGVNVSLMTAMLGCTVFCPSCAQGAPCPCQLVGNCGQRDEAQRPVDSCGDFVCGAKESCCNASCGMCAAPGEMCTQQVCGTSEKLEVTFDVNHL